MSFYDYCIEAKLKFHLLGNLELEFAFMIDFLKRMVLGYYLESRLVSRPHSNATRIRWQDIDMYIHQLVCSLRFMCQVVVCLLLLSYIVPLLHKHISIIKLPDQFSNRISWRNIQLIQYIQSL